MDRADRVIAFIETLKAPDGRDVGQPIVLRPWQKDILRQVYGPVGPDGRRICRQAILSVGRKNGKGLSLNTPIPTPSGWTTMGEVSVGDVLYDEQGNECHVTFVSDIHHLDCYEVTFSNGEKIICDGDHRWLTTARVIRPGYGKKASLAHHTDVRDTREIFKTQVYGKRQDRNHSVAMPEPICGREQDLQLDPYLLGAWLGDGCSAKSEIVCGDEDLEEMTSYLKETGWPVRVYKDRTAWRILLTDGDRHHNRTKDCVQRRLRNIGVFGDKHIPQEYLRASFEQRLALLQGLMDTDGTCDKRGRSQEYCTNLPALRDDFCELLASLGIKYSVRTKLCRCNGKQLETEAYYVQFCVNRDRFPVFRLSRKKERQKADGSVAPRSRTVQIVSVKEVPTVPTKCIQVDSPNSLFLCGKTMLPTHNTALVAGLCLAHLCGPEAIRNGQLYSVAFDREQAAILFKYMAAMVYADDELSARLNVVESRKRILDPISGSEYQALSAETRGKHGKSSSFIVFDELAQFGADRELYDVMMTSRGAHAEPMVWVISTQAASDTAVLSELIDYGEKVNRGEIDDPKTRCFCFSVPMTDDPWDEANWKKSNPALGDFRSLDEMRETAERAKRIPSAEAAFRNLYLNQRVDGAAHFITPAVWKHNGGEPDLSLFEDLPVYAGLDLSAKNDLTALVLTCRDGTGPWHVLPYFWTPKEGLVDRAERDRTPYDVWVKQGYLYTTPGRTVDYAFVAQEIKKLMSRMHIAGLKFDRWRIDDMVRELRDVGVEAYVDGKEEAYPDGLRMIPHGQGFRDMNPAVEALEDALANGKIRHGMHPVLTMCASNVRVQQDPSGNRKFDKIKSTGRIDGIVALAMALNGAVGGEPERTEFFAEAW